MNVQQVNDASRVLIANGYEVETVADGFGSFVNVQDPVRTYGGGVCTLTHETVKLTRMVDVHRFILNRS